MFVNHAGKHPDLPLIKNTSNFFRTNYFRVINNNPRELPNLHKLILRGKTITELIDIKT